MVKDFNILILIHGLMRHQKEKLNSFFVRNEKLSGRNAIKNKDQAKCHYHFNLICQQSNISSYIIQLINQLQL